jgi:hypothetical protein
VRHLILFSKWGRPQGRPAVGEGKNTSLPGEIARRIAIAASVAAAMRVLDKVVIGNSLILDARRSGA